MNAFVFTSPSHVHLFMLILLINQIYNHFHHDIFFLGAALGNHQGEGNEGVVGNTLWTIGTIENAVAVEEPQEERGGNAFVAVAERMVLRVR